MAASIVVELKAVKALEDVHFAVVRSYLWATGREHGLILNFAKPTLEIKRVIASQRPHHDFLASLEAPFSVKQPGATGQHFTGRTLNSRAKGTRASL
ncbi:MAG TPA: GxxExxY protein [Polyangia bacterium]